MTAAIVLAQEGAQLLAQQATFYEEQGLSVEVPEAQLRRVHDEMAAAVAAAEKVIASVREMTGPNPGPAAAHLLTMLGLGTGYLRHSRDTLRRLFRARNAIRRARKKEAGKPC